jgi:hypothetical protein
MWPLKTGRQPTPQLAGVPAYAHLFELWSRARHREALSTYQLGYLRARHSARAPGRAPLPLLQLLVAPGQSIDFADVRTGFPGLTRAPAARRVLTLWADDLLSVRHGDDWIYVIDAEQPFTRAWLDLVSPRGGAAGARYAVVTAAFDGPAPAGQFRVAELDATVHTTFVHIEDRRANT